MNSETFKINKNSSIEFHDYTDKEVRIRINAFDNDVVLKDDTFEQMIKLYKEFRNAKRKQKRPS